MRKNLVSLIVLIFFIFFLLFSFQLVRADYGYCQKKEGVNCEDCTTIDCCEKNLVYAPHCAWDNTIINPATGNFGICALAGEVKWPKSPAGTQISKCSNITGLVKYFYEWGITLGGLITFIALLIAGFQYLTSVGEPAKMTEAKNSIYSALFGLVLLLSSWLILNTINSQLTTFKTQLTLVPISPPSLISVSTESTPCEFITIFQWPSSLGGVFTTSTESLSEPNKIKNLKTTLGAPTDLLQIGSYVFYRKREITNKECSTTTAAGIPEGIPGGEGIACAERITDYWKCTDNRSSPPREFICTKKDNKYYELEPCDSENESCCDPDHIYYPGDSIFTSFCSSGYYKNGGACLFELYMKTGWWIFGGDCAAKAVSISASRVSNIMQYLPGHLGSDEFKDMCVKVSKVTY